MRPVEQTVLLIAEMQYYHRLMGWEMQRIFFLIVRAHFSNRVAARFLTLALALSVILQCLLV